MLAALRLFWRPHELHDRHRCITHANRSAMAHATEEERRDAAAAAAAMQAAAAAAGGGHGGGGGGGGRARLDLTLVPRQP